jgi:glycopeptide antibiotics resistance protein
MLLALAQRKVTWFGMILYGFFLSLFIEVVQLLTGFGSFDVDDLILNVLGTVIGFGVSKVMIKYRTKG